MDNFGAILSVESAPGHAALLLLAIAWLAPSTLAQRLLLGVASLSGLVFAVTQGSILLALWAILFFLIAALLLARYLLAARAARFSEEEDQLRAILAKGLHRAGARLLIDQGNWINARAGETLIREGEPASHLVFLRSGEAEVRFQNKPVARLRAGELIGDATALSGMPANGTVTLVSDSRIWCAEAAALRAYLRLHADARAVVERQINASLDRKLRAANAALAADS